jgi:hypothetical protein
VRYFYDSSADFSNFKLKKPNQNLPRPDSSGGVFGCQHGKNGENENMNKLKDYVKDTINEALEHYNNVDAVIADAAQGINSGWWSDLIYYDDIIDKFQGFKYGIKLALHDYAEATGETTLNNDFTTEEIVRTFFATAEEIKQDDTLKRATSWLVSFGVEWTTHEYASQLEQEKQT